MSSSGRQMSTRVIGGEGGGAAPPPPSAERHSSSSSNSSSDADLDEGEGEEQQQQQQQRQQHNGHGGDGGFLPNTAQKQKAQYMATLSEKRKQTTRDLRITETLLHPAHGMAFGVWSTSKGQVKACSKGIGTDIKLRDQVVETLLAGIQNFTPSEKEISKLQHAEDAFFGGVLTRLKLCTLVRCLGYRTAAKVDPAVGSLVRVCVCT